MKRAHAGVNGFQAILVQKEVEVLQALRRRDGIAIEKSPDPMDEIQDASERDLSIRNVDRGSILLRQVRAALSRVRDGGFGTCMECEEAIGPKRLQAVPWAARCIRCQDAADRDGRESTDFVSQTFVGAA